MPSYLDPMLLVVLMIASFLLGLALGYAIALGHAARTLRRLRNAEGKRAGGARG